MSNRAAAKEGWGLNIGAFERCYFRPGFGCHTLCKGALTRIGKFYEDNQAEIDAQRIFTLDFATGLDTKRPYPKAKIIDMNFFQEGFKANGHGGGSLASLG